MEKIKRNIKETLIRIWDDPCALFSIFGFVFTSLAGTLLHFLPDLVENNFVYLFAPTNESVWEHLKLLFYPYLVFMTAEYFAYGKYREGFLGAKLRGVLVGNALIVLVHYLYTGIVGTASSALDIALFFIGTAVAYALPYVLIKRGAAKNYSATMALVGFLLVILTFSVFTFVTPKLAIFLDMESGTWGIQ